MTLRELTPRERADRIPELGGGGKTCGDLLIRLASEVAPGEAIVDIAPWVGSTTAYLAIGAKESGATVHSFDRWVIDEEYRAKAERHNKLTFQLGEDIFPVWSRNLDPFLDARIVPHRGDIRNATWWRKTPIGLLVDDISNTPELIASTMRIFAPSLREGSIVVLMDWQFQILAQREWMYRNREAFKFVEALLRPSMAGVFRRSGGELNL